MLIKSTVSPLVSATSLNRVFIILLLRLFWSFWSLRFENRFFNPI